MLMDQLKDDGQVRCGLMPEPCGRPEPKDTGGFLWPLPNFPKAQRIFSLAEIVGLSPVRIETTTFNSYLYVG